MHIKEEENNTERRVGGIFSLASNKSEGILLISDFFKARKTCTSTFRAWQSSRVFVPVPPLPPKSFARVCRVRVGGLIYMLEISWLV